jgi:drug/metabolite transporter (DMT)-like permease
LLGRFILTIAGRLRRSRTIDSASSLKKGDLSWLAGANLEGSIVAPIALMYSLTVVSGFTASLLLNLEEVAPAIIAVIVFKEYAGKRLWLALVPMTSAGVFLSWNPSHGEVKPCRPAARRPGDELLGHRQHSDRTHLERGPT